MEAEALKLLLSHPLFSGGTMVGALLGLLYYARKVYMSIKQDSANTDIVTTNIAATRQVVEILNDQVARLTQRVNELQDTVLKYTEERRALIEEVVKLTRELEQCRSNNNVSIQSTERE